MHTKYWRHYTFGKGQGCCAMTLKIILDPGKKRKRNITIQNYKLLFLNKVKYKQTFAFAFLIHIFYTLQIRKPCFHFSGQIDMTSEWGKFHCLVSQLCLFELWTHLNKLPLYSRTSVCLGTSKTSFCVVIVYSDWQVSSILRESSGFLFLFYINFDHIKLYYFKTNFKQDSPNFSKIGTVNETRQLFHYPHSVRM